MPTSWSTPPYCLLPTPSLVATETSPAPQGDHMIVTVSALLSWQPDLWMRTTVSAIQGRVSANGKNDKIHWVKLYCKKWWPNEMEFSKQMFKFKIGLMYVSVVNFFKRWITFTLTHMPILSLTYDTLRTCSGGHHWSHESSCASCSCWPSICS